MNILREWSPKFDATYPASLDGEPCEVEAVRRYGGEYIVFARSGEHVYDDRDRLPIGYEGSLRFGAGKSFDEVRELVGRMSTIRIFDGSVRVDFEVFVRGADLAGVDVGLHRIHWLSRGVVETH